MTAHVIIDLISRYKMDERKTLISVHPKAIELDGTTANLLAGEQLTIWELLHAMMLPSGNDAA